MWEDGLRMGGLVSEPISPVGGDIFERYHEAGAVQFGEVSPIELHQAKARVLLA